MCAYLIRTGVRNLKSINDGYCPFGELEHYWNVTQMYRCKQLAEIIQRSEGSTNDVLRKCPH